MTKHILTQDSITAAKALVCRLCENGHVRMSVPVDFARDEDMLICALIDAAEKSLVAPTSPASGALPADTLYVATHECRDCAHVGINDESSTDAACNTCDWSGPSPKEDQCPGCGRDGTMTSACPKCGERYHLLAEAWLPLAALASRETTEPTEAQKQQVIAEFLERTGQYVTNDASREAAIASAVAAALASREAVEPSPAVPVPATLLGAESKDVEQAHDQCCAVIHMANALAEIYRARAATLETGLGHIELIGQSSAEVMEWLGDTLNGMDAVDESDAWIEPIIQAAHVRWPIAPAALASPQVDPAPKPAANPSSIYEMAAMLPEGVSWHDPITPGMVQHIIALAAPAPVAPTLTRRHIDNAQEVADSKHGVFTWGEAPGSWRETFAHEIARSIGAPVAPTPSNDWNDAIEAAAKRIESGSFQHDQSPAKLFADEVAPVLRSMKRPVHTPATGEADHE